MFGFKKSIATLVLILPLAGCFGSSEDKVRHFAAGGAAAWAAREMGAPAWAGCATAFAVGALKEHYDRNRGGNWDNDDLLATVAGCSITIAF